MWWKNLHPTQCEYLSIDLSVPSPGQCGGKTKSHQNHCQNPDDFQYPLRVNVVEKPHNQSQNRPTKKPFSTLSGSMWWKNLSSASLFLLSHTLSVPSPGQCGGKTRRDHNFVFCHPNFQYPLRVNVVEKLELTAAVIGERDFQYPLRVNVVEKPPNPCAWLWATFNFQYPLRVNVVEKPRIIVPQVNVCCDFQYPLRVNVVEKPPRPGAILP